jgi:hypothetical protein
MIVAVVVERLMGVLVAKEVMGLVPVDPVDPVDPVLAMLLMMPVVVFIAVVVLITVLLPITPTAVLQIFQMAVWVLLAATLMVVNFFGVRVMV